jgi:metallo-beta-lactamase class B
MWVKSNRIAGSLVVLCLLGASSPMAQQGNRSGRGGADRIDWNKKTPWGARERLGPLPEYIRDPFKIFDNIYYVGLRSVSSFLVTTSAGMVLLDATFPETPDSVIANIRKAGFDPANLKYIFITHSHYDHFGGAGKIRQVTGARVGMSAEDWESTLNQQKTPGRGEPLTKDVVLADNGSMTIGDTTFKFYVTPGHTVGATSIEFPARENGRSYRMLAPGGMGLSMAPEWTPVYIKSFERLKRLGPWDGVLGNHPFAMPRDLEWEIEKDLATRKPGDPNPAVVGAGSVNAWLDEILKAAHEKADYEQAQKGR